MKKEDMVDRLIRYMRINTVSSLESKKYPSTDTQKKFANILKEDLVSVGVNPKWIKMIRDVLLICRIPASVGYENKKHICLAAHMDTFGDPNRSINPVLRNYEGGDIFFDQNNIISARELADFKGQRIITSDGTTNIGGDDKIGIVGIMHALEIILNEGHDHGPITVMFFPDEEIGSSPADHLGKMLNNFDCIFTFDGLELGSVAIESVIGYFVSVEFTGHASHPGVGGDSFVSAIEAAARFVCGFDPNYHPNNSKGLRPYLSVRSMEGDNNKAKVQLYLGGFSQLLLNKIIDDLRFLGDDVCQHFNNKVRMKFVPDKICNNICLAIEKEPWVIDVCKNAFYTMGYKPDCESVRGGTDGGMINMMYPDIPVPNLGIGVRNVHEITEWIGVKEVEDLPRVIINIIQEIAKLK